MTACTYGVEHFVSQGLAGTQYVQLMLSLWQGIDDYRFVSDFLYKGIDEII